MTSLDYYGIEELLSDDERAARDRARRFVQEEVMSEIVAHHRAATFREQLTARMGALGFYAPYLKGHGGAGLSYTAYGLIMLELERADSGLRSLGLGAGIAGHACDSYFWFRRATGALVAGNARGRTSSLFRAHGTWAWLGSGRNGDNRQ